MNVSRLMVFLIFVFSFSNVFSADGSVCQNVKKTKIFYVNDVFIEPEEAAIDANRLHHAYVTRGEINKIYLDEKFEFVSLYNESKGITLDLTELIFQKKINNETGLKPSEVIEMMKFTKGAVLSALATLISLDKKMAPFADAIKIGDKLSDISFNELIGEAKTTKLYIERTLQDIRKEVNTAISENNRIIFFAHGQGGVYLNRVLELINGERNDLRDFVNIISVASFDGYVFEGVNLTAFDDKFVNTLIGINERSVLGGNIDNDIGITNDPRGFLNHDFSRSYLASKYKTGKDFDEVTLPSRGEIDVQFYRNLKFLSYPLGTPPVYISGLNSLVVDKAQELEKIINLSNTFLDIESNISELSYAATVITDTDVATVSVTDKDLKITPLKAGETIISVVANDTDGLCGSHEFKVTVIDNTAPRYVSGLDGISLSGESAGTTVSVVGAFEDTEDEAIALVISAGLVSGNDVITANMNEAGTGIEIAVLRAGEAMVRVTATDSGGLSVTHDFKVTANNTGEAEVTFVFIGNSKPVGYCIKLTEYGNCVQGAEKYNDGDEVTVKLQTSSGSYFILAENYTEEDLHVYAPRAELSYIPFTVTDSSAQRIELKYQRYTGEITVTKDDDSLSNETVFQMCLKSGSYYDPDHPDYRFGGCDGRDPSYPIETVIKGINPETYVVTFSGAYDLEKVYNGALCKFLQHPLAKVVEIEAGASVVVTPGEIIQAYNVPFNCRAIP